MSESSTTPELNTRDYSPMTLRNINRLNKQKNLEHDVKLYVSNKVIDKVYEIKEWAAKLPEVQNGTKSFSAIVWEWVIQRYGEEKLKMEEEKAKKEAMEKQLDNETSKEHVNRVRENIKKNYIDVIVPGRKKKIELPRIDEYIEYIENGGLPISEMIKHEKFSEKELAKIVCSVKALDIELKRTKDCVQTVDKIIKFKKDIKDGFRMTRLEKIFAAVKGTDRWKFNEQRGNMFSVYAQQKLFGQIHDVPKEVVQYLVY